MSSHLFQIIRLKYTHTHTHIYIYIYIYIERERERIPKESETICRGFNQADSQDNSDTELF